MADLQPESTDHYSSVLRPGLYEGSVVVVTGGGSGIGRCMAHELASLGAHVVILGRTESKLADVAAEIIEDGGVCSYRSCDIRDEEQVRETIAWVITEAGSLDGLVNNAGGQYPSTISDMSTKGFEAVVRNNLVGTFNMMREAYNQWMAEHGGAIVNITADHHNGFPGMGHTGASRAGVSTLTKTAAVEWGPAGVRINEVAPGTIASSGYNNYDEAFQQIFAAEANHTPLGRLGTESEVSAVTCFLLSDAAAYITGATIRVDGASSLASRRGWPVGKHTNSPAYDGFHRSTVPDALKG